MGGATVLTDLEVDGTTLVVDETNNRVGIGDGAPGTTLQVKGTAPYVTIQNSTSENTAGGCESKLIFEDHGNNALGQIEVSHVGSSDDEKGQLILSTNNDSGLQAAITIDEAQKVTAAGDVQVTGDIILDDGGSLKEAGGTAAITFDGSGHVTKIGQDSPGSGQFLKWDGSKAVWDAVATGSSAADDISTGDAAVNIATTAGNITLDAQEGDASIIFKGTDDSSDITALTLSMADAGAASFNAAVTVGTDLTVTGGDIVFGATNSTVTVTSTAHDAAGATLNISGGAPTAGTSNNQAGGSVTISGGQGKGSGAGGDIVFKTANAGGSGSSLNALATALTISDDKSATFEDNVTVKGDIIIDDGGSLKEAGGTAALTYNGSAEITTLKVAADSVAVASDHVMFFDGGATGTPKAESIADLVTAFAGTASSTGLSASSGVLSVSDLHPVGVDGSANQILTDDGDGTVTSESKLTFDGTTLLVDSDVTATASHTTVGAHIDYDATGIIASGQTGNNVGLDLDINSNSPTMVGTVNNTGLDIDLTGGTSGTQTNIGIDVNVTGADTNYAAVLNGGNVGVGTSTPGNLLHMAGADAYLLLQNTTAENGDGEAETRILFGDHSGTALAQVEGSHSGSSDDTKGKFVVSTHNGSSLTTALSIDDTQKAVFAGDVEFGGDTHTFASANSEDPLIIIKNTTNDANGSRLRFVKDKGAAGADNDVAGAIEFYADDDNQDNILFGKIEGIVADASNGAEGGRVTISVASNDGEIQPGLVVEDGSGEDEVNVIIGNVSTSKTSVSGALGVRDSAPKVSLNVVHDYNTATFENQLADGEGGGRVLRYSPGADDTLTVGQLYFLHTDGTWDQTDADAVATGATQMLGIGLGNARTAGCLMEGFIRIPSTEILNVPGSGAVDGLPVYVSTTAGHLDFTAPSGAGDFVRIVGHAIDDDSGDVLIYFNPSNNHVEL
tara:strand:- start:3693 stop:6569 length:2877 start_codon:yes stop_codon:yes gene_type:complete